MNSETASQIDEFQSFPTKKSKSFGLLISNFKIQNDFVTNYKIYIVCELMFIEYDKKLVFSYFFNKKSQFMYTLLSHRLTLFCSYNVFCI